MGEVGDLIKRLRTTAELKQPQLARDIGTTQQRISDWENGNRSPTWDQARALGEYFSRNPTDFYEKAPVNVAAPPPGLVAELPAETASFAYPDVAGIDMTPWPVPVMDGYNPRGCAFFGKDFLKRHSLNPLRCRVVDVLDSSMSPVLPLGSTCLIDENRTGLVDGALYLFEHQSELLIREARQATNGAFLLAKALSEPALRWDDVKVIGQVYWVGWIVAAPHGQAAPDLKVVASDDG